MSTSSTNVARPLGSVSNFTIQHRAGFSCYVRAAYCDSGSFENASSIVLTDRIEGRINLGDGVTRSLKDAGIPEGAAVQLVIELVAAGNPTVMSAETWTYSESSFRTATYKVSGTVFNPKLARVVRARPPPPPPVAALSLPMPMSEETPLLQEKQALADSEEEADSWSTWFRSWICC